MQPNRSLDLLFPPFRACLEKGLAAAQAAGLHAFVFEAWRSRERQAFLYAQGRSAPGNIVTWVRPGLSAHEYGLGVDLVFDGSPSPGIQWNWEGDYADKNRDSYAALAPIMKAAGLEWLGDKNVERAHFQMLFGLTLSEINSQASARGVLGLWDGILTKLGG